MSWAVPARLDAGQLLYDLRQHLLHLLGCRGAAAGGGQKVIEHAGSLRVFATCSKRVAMSSKPMVLSGCTRARVRLDLCTSHVDPFRAWSAYEDPTTSTRENIP